MPPTDYSTFAPSPRATSARQDTLPLEWNTTFRANSSPRSTKFWLSVIFAFVFVAALAFGPSVAIVATARAFLGERLFPSSHKSAETAAPEGKVDSKNTFRIEMTAQEVTYSPDLTYEVYALTTAAERELAVDPGDTFQIELANNLPALSAEQEAQARDLNEYAHMSSTLLHTHGLHVSPLEDDVFKEPCRPQQVCTTSYTILEDHPPGTYWVHPHHHGSLAPQTAFAAARMLIVRDTDGWWRSLSEANVMVQRAGAYSGHTGWDQEKLFRVSDSNLRRAEGGSKVSEFVLVNGRVAPSTVATCPMGAAQRWRVLNAAIDGGLVLQTPVSNTCKVYLIARDGVYLRQGKPRKMINGVSRIVLPPGGRADFLMLQSRNKKASCRLENVGPTSFITSALGVSTKFIPPVTLLECEGFESSTDVLHAEIPTNLPRLPQYLSADLVYRFGDPPVEHRTIEWNEIGQLHAEPDDSPAKHKAYGINGRAYDGKSRFKMRLGRLQEWVVQNRVSLVDGSVALESHPFHLHTNHFEIFSSSHGTSSTITKSNSVPDDGMMFEKGLVLDTTFVPAPGNVTIRFRPAHYVGKSLAHCHNLVHETFGMSVAFAFLPKLVT